MAEDNKKAPTGIIISILVLVMVLAIVLIVLYSICIAQFVHEKLTVKEDITITVNCDCKCADGCKCTENNDCKCTDRCKCGDEKYIIVTNPTAPNITVIVCITSAFIAILICFTVIAVKLIAYCKHNSDKSNEKEITDKMLEAYKTMFLGKNGDSKEQENQSH